MSTAGSGVQVEEVRSGPQLRRFAELPAVLYAGRPAWRPPERRFDRHRHRMSGHDYFDAGDGVQLLARRGGQPVGRVAVHVDDRRATAAGGPRTGFFGFFDVVDDAVGAVLLDRAASWLAERGRTRMVGPRSWTDAEEVGTLVDGFEKVGATGLPWRPMEVAECLRAAGGSRDRVHPIHRIALAPPEESMIGRVRRGPVPPHAGRYADPALALDGIAAVPDVSGLSDVSVRGAWRTAGRAAKRQWSTAVCVRCDGDPAELVPELAAAAAAAGYVELLAPWSPEPRAPERVFAEFSLEL